MNITAKRARSELLQYCDGMSADALSPVAWPSLAETVEGWLNLSLKAAGFPDVGNAINTGSTI